MDLFFIFCLIAVIIVGGVYLAQVLYNRQQPTLKLEETKWQRLAQAQKLKYMPESDQDTAVFSGSYKHHLLTLRKSTQGNSTTTYISLQRQDPPTDKIEEKVLDKLAAIAHSCNFKGSLKLEANGTIISYTELNMLETNPDYLQNIFKLLHELITIYPQIIELEEEALARLPEIGQISKTLQPICLQMLVDICQQTTQRGLAYGVPLVCNRCFVHFNILPLTLPDKARITYYGCRVCGQSREFLPLEAEIVAILNNQETTGWLQAEGQIKVNWLVHRRLFDFDRVEIQHATDEEVERFAVQIGNDTDEARQPRYQEMACIISLDCQLSESAVRILDHIFGKVVKESL